MYQAHVLPLAFYGLFLQIQSLKLVTYKQMSGLLKVWI